MDDCKVLVAYPLERGRCEAVAEAIAEAFADIAITADIAPAELVTDLAPYAALVLGAPRDADAQIHPSGVVQAGGGRRPPLPLAVFGLESGELDERTRADSHARLEQALTRLPRLDPVAVAVFSTAVLHDHPCPASPVPALDLLDWEAIRDWTHTLPGLLGLPVPVG
jgi:menaquinone-dependent protoporphyrinogen IX oxidase